MPLHDIALRKAICYAIDRKTLAEIVFFDGVIPVGHMMNPLFEDCSQKVDPFTTDIAKAQRILKEAGYVLNEKGVLSKNGTPITLTYFSSTGTVDKELAEFIQSDLKKIGITVNIHLAEPVLLEEKRKNGAYDISHSVLWFKPTINTLSFYGL